MPKDKDFKRHVRDRQAKTGESYTTARHQLLARSVSPAKPPVVCAITGAAGRVAYNFVFRVASGEVFGPETPVALRLIDVEEALPSLAGTVIELEDCSYPLLASVDMTSDYEAGFAGASWVVLLGAPRRTAEMQRGDLLAQTAASFAVQGAAVQASASSDVRVHVVANPANTNGLVARRAAPDMPDDRWMAMLRLDHNRTRARLADQANVPLDSVSRVAVWGNHSATMVPDVWHARIDGTPATEMVAEQWITSTLIPGVQQRGAQLIEVSGSSSAASAASALTDDIRTLLQGTHDDDWVSAGVVSNGEYGIPAGLVFGYPVAVRPNQPPRIVEDLAISDTQRHLLDRSVNELLNEQETALQLVDGA